VQPNKRTGGNSLEQTKENNFEWTPPENDSYTGFAGGPLVRPTTYVQGIAMGTQNLASIFLAILPLTFFSKVTELTNKYCYDYEDWVVKKTGGQPTPGRRHRTDRNQDKLHITPGFIKEQK
jgi:hypothetical protein